MSKICALVYSFLTAANGRHVSAEKLTDRCQADGANAWCTFVGVSVQSDYSCHLNISHGNVWDVLRDTSSNCKK